jgi:hypothetical protein
MSAGQMFRDRDYINPREVQRFPEPSGQDAEMLPMQPEPARSGGAVQAWTPLDHASPPSPCPSERDDSPAAADDSESSVFSLTARGRAKIARRRASRTPRVRRGSTVTTARTTPASSGAVVRAPRARRASNGGGGGGGAGPGNRAGPAARPFPCQLAPYGCEATFPSKNEWKRHVGTQHVKLGLWRCALCRRPPVAVSVGVATAAANAVAAVAAADGGSAAAAAASGRRSPAVPAPHNDFNRKDLFTQHLRRMHPRALARVDPNAAQPDDIDADVDEDAEDEPSPSPSAAPAPPATTTSAPQDDEEEARAARLAREDAAVHYLVGRCFLPLREAPTRCGCPLCDARFEGEAAWETRIDHLAAHWENERRTGCRPTRPAQWRRDVHLEEYLVEEGLIETEAGGRWRIGRGSSRRARKMGWF